jgi:hypothetical protein
MLKEEHRVMIFGYKVFRRISGPKRDEVTGGWRRLHNKQLNSRSSPNIIRVINSGQ